jgi:hypothetical protein
MRGVEDNPCDGETDMIKEKPWEGEWGPGCISTEEGAIVSHVHILTVMRNSEHQMRSKKQPARST